MEFLDLVKSRSYRRFHQEVPVEKAHLLKMVEAARFSPSARNVQPSNMHFTPHRNSVRPSSLLWPGRAT